MYACKLILEFERVVDLGLWISLDYVQLGR